MAGRLVTFPESPIPGRDTFARASSETRVTHVILGIMTARFEMVRRAPLALACVAVLSLTAACSEDAPPSPAITLDAAPVASGDPQPQSTSEPDPGDDLERAESLQGQPAGTPVTPEILMTNVDEQSDELSIVVYVPRIFESGGVCTVLVVNATVELTQESQAEADASGTACGLFSFALSELGAGAATITATYESADHQGESAQLKVDIP